MQEKAKEPEIRFAGFTGAWEQRKLSDLCSMHARIGWQNLRTSEFLDQGQYLLITGTDLVMAVSVLIPAISLKKKDMIRIRIFRSKMEAFSLQKMELLAKLLT